MSNENEASPPRKKTLLEQIRERQEQKAKAQAEKKEQEQRKRDEAWKRLPFNQLSVADRHKAYSAHIGQQYLGFAEEGWEGYGVTIQIATHCRNKACRHPLNSRAHERCASCRRIVCSNCGTCLCNGTGNNYFLWRPFELSAASIASLLNSSPEQA